MKPTPSRAFLLGVAIIMAASLFFAAAGRGAEPSIAATTITLGTGSGEIAAEVFQQPDEKKRPAILVLHGAGGTLLDGPEMRRVARELAGAGNAVYLVHYFESTGTLFARDASMEKNFGTWLQTVLDSIGAIQEARRDSSPVGIYGYSLGGFLALLAASNNAEVAAVVEHAGGIWNGDVERIGKMPPVLMVHGERDARVPFAKYAKPLVPILRSRARTLETHFVPGEGHGFAPGPMKDVRAAAANFFRKHVATR